jgi:hypothetical protein
MEILLPFFFLDVNSTDHYTQTEIGGGRSSVRRFTYSIWTGAVRIFQNISQQIVLKPQRKRPGDFSPGLDG